MELCIVQKVQFKSGTCLRWAVVLAEREGLSLLFVRRPDDKRSHAIVIGAQNAQGIFEDVPNVSCFPMESGDLEEVGDKLRALGQNLSNEEFRRGFFRGDDSWWKE